MVFFFKSKLKVEDSEEEVKDQKVKVQDNGDLKKSRNFLFVQAQEINALGANNNKNMEKRDEEQNVLGKNRSMEKIELEFCDVYHQALKKLLDLEEESNLLYLRRFLRIFLPLTNSWCNFNSSNKKDREDIQLLRSSLYYRFIYIYRNCMVLSSIVAFHFQNVLMDNPLFCRKMQEKKSVKICCLGSGSAADVVGIVNVLETVCAMMNFELEVFVTIVNSDLGWKNAAMVVLNGLQQFRGAVWKINFIQADLSEDFSPSTLKSIQDADIVTMVNFVMEFANAISSKKKKKRPKMQRIIENITDVILPGSMLFILDFSRQHIIKRCGGHTGQVKDFQLIYEELCDFYKLQTSTVKKLFVRYHKTFPSFGCNRSMTAFARVWIKRFPGADSPDEVQLKNRFLITRVNQNSLDTSNYFQNWEHQFYEEMAKLGWKKRSIQKVISGHREKRSRLMKKHFENKKLVEDARKKLMDMDEGEDGRETEEDAWEKYFKAKRDFSCVKNGVCNMSIFNMKCNLKRNMLGYSKKSKVTKKKG